MDAAESFVLWTPEDAKGARCRRADLGWRCKKTGPDYIRVGKKIRYTPQTVREFLESRRVTNKLIARAQRPVPKKQTVKV
jgi:hypothetical protein